MALGRPWERIPHKIRAPLAASAHKSGAGDQILPRTPADRAVRTRVMSSVALPDVRDLLSIAATTKQRGAPLRTQEQGE
jgi:hypothetical protein